MIFDIINLLIALAAISIAGLSLYLQRRDRLPRLRVSADDRSPDDLGDMIYSVRVVNEGSVPAQVRSVRLFLEKRRSRFQLGIPPWLVEERRSIPFPSVEEGEGDIVHNLWSNEKDATKALPYMLQQGDSVRFAAPYHTVATRLRDAGLHGTGSTYVSFRVGVVDALDDAHTVEDTMVVDAPQPEP